jgi:hypothetical protein
MGKSEVSDKCRLPTPTVSTWSMVREYLERCDEPLLRATIMHEVGHKFLRHISHYQHIFKRTIGLPILPQTLSSMTSSYVGTHRHPDRRGLAVESYVP